MISPAKAEPDVELFTDGACSGNPGPGGWGAILRYGGAEGDKEKELAGSAPETTNNRMELSAVIEGLQALTRPCRVAVHSDSRYVVDAINKGWLDNWQARDWRKAAAKGTGKPVLNRDLWERLIPLLATHKVTFHWVRGHTGHPENERADRLAVAQIQR